MVRKRLDGRTSNDTVDRYDPRTADEHTRLRGYFSKLRERFPERMVALDTSDLNIEQMANKGREILRSCLKI